MRLSFSLLLLTLFSMVATAQTLPTFSTDDAETWYFIQFRNGEAALMDYGEAKNLQTAEIDKSNQAQRWKIVGTQNDCEICGRRGNSSR